MQLLKRLSGMRQSRWRPVPFVVALAAIASLHGKGEVDDAAPSRSWALVGALAHRGLSCAPEDVTWISGPRGIWGAMRGGARAVVRATRRADEPPDLYLVTARLSPEGALLEAGNAYNLTSSMSVEEGPPILDGTVIAYGATFSGAVTSVHTIDLGGRSPAVYTDFTRTQRWQTAITNLQQTGQREGVVHDTYALDPAATKAELEWSADHRLHVVADGHAVVIDRQQKAAVLGASWVRAIPDVRAKPPAVAQWASDRSRALLGDEANQIMKAVVFTGLEKLLDLRAKVLGDSSAKDVADDLGGVNSGQTTTPTFIDPEIGWPPAPMQPVIKPPLPGEGQWITLDRDPFTTQIPGAPPAFVTSFVRTDPKRPVTRIYVTLWDPRQIALHMEAGTIEPVSASGEAGPGVIPRTPEVMRRVIGGFNGGFQATHGEFGMEANGIQYLPPKPYAATVLELRDGSTAFGSWPKSADVPEDVLSYRQNLTALVQDGKFNPWGRNWWGGTPIGWADNIHTTRSGICLTRENYVGYFYGIDISPEVLAQGMIIARCAFGVHLDMNPGLAGFEFYNVQPARIFKPLGRPLQADWEYEGTVRELPEFKFRARRMIKNMQEMNFPAYIQRDGRDFFYLTARPVLPGSELVGVEPREPGEGVWRVKALPQHGFPYAMATTWVRPDPSRPEVKVRVLRVDPRTVRAAGSAGTSADSPTIVSFAAQTTERAPGTPRSGGEVRPADERVWLANGVFTISASAPSAEATMLAAGTVAAKAAPSRAAVGVHDEDGMLNWLELAPDIAPSAATTAILDKLLARTGCTSRMIVSGDVHALLGGSLTITADPSPPAPGGGSRLVRGPAPGARPIFETTEIVGPNVWTPLQNQRVRYFRRAAPAKPDAGAPAPPASDAPSAAPANSAPPP